MKILITSDNHLGYKERDPIRKDDSFNTLEEILFIAKQENVDIILQGGDLFDENKPSINTYNRTLKLLKKYCFGDKKSTIHFSIPLNFTDKNLRVAIPVLSIHGNHDDPSGLNSVSPLDVLHSSGLINYFGKCENIENIVIEPILIESGQYKVAIYGLGYMKDRALYRTFMKGNVQYNKPEGDGWYNILIVHQNRVPRAEEYLPEDFIDPFIDLVVYGHEHESLRLCHRNFEVIQCGSTVRTSLSEGESHSKYIYILDFEATTRIRRRQLGTVRPFIMDNIKILSGEPELIIKNKLEQMFIKAKQLSVPPIFPMNESSGGIVINTESSGGIIANTGIPVQSMMLPLIRLRVELGEDKAINKHCLNAFVENRVANDTDVLRILKKYSRKQFKARMPVKRFGICEIYKELLSNVELNTLVVPRIIDALNDFVGKDDRDSWTNLIKESVMKIMNIIDAENVVLEDLEKVIKGAKERICKLEGDLSLQQEITIDSEPEIIFGEGDLESLCRGQESFSMKGEDLCSNGDLMYVNSNSFLNGKKPSISSSVDFTFLEDKNERYETNKILQECQETILTEPRIKKQKDKESDEDLLTFTKYL